MFELNATLDHVSRHWAYGESESEVVGQAFSHLKRSCFDIFKLKVKEARSQYDTLCKIDTSMIDNGDYDRELHRLFNDIRLGATEARRLEGETDASNSVPAFERWEQVYVKCVELEKEFFLHTKLNWARRKGRVAFIRNIALGFVIGVASSLVAALLLGLVSGVRPLGQ